MREWLWAVLVSSCWAFDPSAALEGVSSDHKALALAGGVLLFLLLRCCRSSPRSQVTVVFKRLDAAALQQLTSAVSAQLADFRNQPPATSQSESLQGVTEAVEQLKTLQYQFQKDIINAHEQIWEGLSKLGTAQETRAEEPVETRTEAPSTEAELAPTELPAAATKTEEPPVKPLRAPTVEPPRKDSEEVKPPKVEEGKVTKPPEPTRKPPEEVKETPEEVKKPPEEVKKPPEGAKKPPEEAKKPPEEAKKPPEEAKKPPEEAKKPPEEVKRPAETPETRPPVPTRVPPPQRKPGIARPKVVQPAAMSSPFG